MPYSAPMPNPVDVVVDNARYARFAQKDKEINDVVDEEVEIYVYWFNLG